LNCRTMSWVVYSIALKGSVGRGSTNTNLVHAFVVGFVESPHELREMVSVTPHNVWERGVDLRTQ
jgi:hypothetical protein